MVPEVFENAAPAGPLSQAIGVTPAGKTAAAATEIVLDAIAVDPSTASVAVAEIARDPVSDGVRTITPTRPLITHDPDAPANVTVTDDAGREVLTEIKTGTPAMAYAFDGSRIAIEMAMFKKRWCGLPCGGQVKMLGK
jgi:hypothetical protein